jgi:hypothetical protein
MLPFLALSPVHNSLEDSPSDVQNRQAEQHVLQHVRIQLLKPAMYSPVWPCRATLPAQRAAFVAPNESDKKSDLKY